MMAMQGVGKMRAAPASSRANIIQWPPHPAIPRQVAPQPYPPGRQYQDNAGPTVVARKKVTPP
jgi:hypothetical protein